MRRHLFAMLTLILAAVIGSFLANAQTIDGCSSVPKNRVATSQDVAKLKSDANCFDRAKAMADDYANVRRVRIAALAKPVEPAPMPPATPAPSLAELAKVASGVNVASFLSPAWGTGQIPPPEGGEGAFRFICAPGHLSYDDPVIFPGQPGRSHLHQWFGNTKANAFSTYASLRTTGDSTCNNVLNRSAYWIPAMMNGRGKVVLPDYVSIYYKTISSKNPACLLVAKACINTPRGLRYVFGYNMQNPDRSSPAGSAYWNCDGTGAVSGHFANIAQAAKGCPAGSRLGMVLTGPTCWNGKDLDSPDHRSHLAYTEQNGYGVAVCPPTHPYLIPHFTIAAWYTTDTTLDRSGDESVDAKTWFLASDRMPGMANAVPGTTLHSDWFGAWEDSVLETWFGNCIEKELSCSGADLGNGTQMTDVANVLGPLRVRLVDPPARTL